MQQHLCEMSTNLKFHISLRLYENLVTMLSTSLDICKILEKIRQNLRVTQFLRKSDVSDLSLNFSKSALNFVKRCIRSEKFEKIKRLSRKYARGKKSISRSRKMLENEAFAALLAKLGVDTAENKPSKVFQKGVV